MIDERQWNAKRLRRVCLGFVETGRGQMARAVLV